MRFLGVIGLAVAGLAAPLLGCVSTSEVRGDSPTNAATAPHERGSLLDDVCPVKVPGTTAASVDVQGGGALIFTTSASNVAELRRRLRRIAERHNRHYASSEAMPGEGNASASHAHEAVVAPGREARDREGMMIDGGMMMPLASAAVEEIDGGARLVLRPKDPTQLLSLREHLHQRLRRMAGGECPTMAPEAERQALPALSGQ